MIHSPGSWFPQFWKKQRGEKGKKEGKKKEKERKRKKGKKDREIVRNTEKYNKILLCCYCCLLCFHIRWTYQILYPIRLLRWRILKYILGWNHIDFLKRSHKYNNKQQKQHHCWYWIMKKMIQQHLQTNDSNMSIYDTSAYNS